MKRVSKELNFGADPSTNTYKEDQRQLLFVMILFSLSILLNVIIQVWLACSPQDKKYKFFESVSLFLVSTIFGEFVPFIAIMLLHLKNFKKQGEQE